MDDATKLQKLQKKMQEMQTKTPLKPLPLTRMDDASA
jgi:hypothetical protein